MNTDTTRVLGILIAIALATSLVAAPVAAQDDHEEFLVELDADGDADVAVTFAFELDSEEQRAAFEELEANATARDAFTERFENRMTAVATDAAEATDREMSVGDASITVETTGDVGLVTLNLHWEGLAAVDGDRLTVTEPFASGFEPDRAFTVQTPDGHEITSATPEPSTDGTTTASWEAGASLEGFELTAAGTGNADTDGDGSGLGVLTAVGALLVTALLARRW